MGLLDPGSAELCQILERGASSLQGTRLAELCIQGMDTDGLGGDGHFGEMRWLAAILENARSLQRLVLSCGCIGKFPVLLQLRHLVLHIHEDISRQACLSLEGLTCLETISIRMMSATMADTSLPAMNLSACKKLAAVHLQYVVPEKLGVPTGCLVKMDCVSDDFPDESLWNLCQVCTGFMLEPRGLLDTAPWLDMLCMSWPWLTSLEIDTTRILCQSGVPLVFGGAMPRLQYLNITSIYLVLEIEAPIHLQRLVIRTRRINELTVHDLPVLVDKMTTLTVKPWFRESFITVLDSSYDELVSAYTASLCRRGISYKHDCVTNMVLTEGYEPYPECACGGACIDCLRKVGKLQPY